MDKGRPRQAGPCIKCPWAGTSPLAPPPSGRDNIQHSCGQGKLKSRTNTLRRLLEEADPLLPPRPLRAETPPFFPWLSRLLGAEHSYSQPIFPAEFQQESARIPRQARPGFIYSPRDNKNAHPHPGMRLLICSRPAPVVYKPLFILFYFNPLSRAHPTFYPRPPLPTATR